LPLRLATLSAYLKMPTEMNKNTTVENRSAAMSCRLLKPWRPVDPGRPAITDGYRPLLMASIQ
jgi:hypothetical protein